MSEPLDLERRAKLVTWCRIFAVGLPCAKPCDDCRRISRQNALRGTSAKENPDA